MGVKKEREMLTLAGYNTFAEFGTHVSFIERSRNSFFNAFNNYNEARE